MFKTLLFALIAVINLISPSNIGRKLLWTSKSIGGLYNQLTLPQSDSICALCKPSLSGGWGRKDKITKPQKIFMAFTMFYKPKQYQPKSCWVIFRRNSKNISNFLSFHFKHRRCSSSRQSVNSVNSVNSENNVSNVSSVNSVNSVNRVNSVNSVNNVRTMWEVWTMWAV